jgi:hypothetical protein
VRVALDWTLDLFFSKDIVQLPTLQRATMSEAEDLGLPTAIIGKNEGSKLAGDYH